MQATVLYIQVNGHGSCNYPAYTVMYTHLCNVSLIIWYCQKWWCHGYLSLRFSPSLFFFYYHAHTKIMHSHFWHIVLLYRGSRKKLLRRTRGLQVCWEVDKLKEADHQHALLAFTFGVKQMISCCNRSKSPKIYLFMKHTILHEVLAGFKLAVWSKWLIWLSCVYIIYVKCVICSPFFCSVVVIYHYPS
jgi:hypothetical protein